MGDFVRTRYIEYKTFKRGRIYAKKELDEAFNDGRILICKDLGDKVRVIAIIKTEFTDPEGVVEDIKKIPICSSDEEFEIYYVGQACVTYGLSSI